jgi:hypothetical protein
MNSPMEHSMLLHAIDGSAKATFHQPFRRSIMNKTRKLLVGMLAAAGIAGAAAIAYADPPGGFGPGMMGYGAWGGGHMGSGAMGYGPGYGRGGPGMWGGGHMGPGMMGYGGPGGYGPGMMGGWGPQGGFGPGAGVSGGPVAHQEARLAFLKGELRITANQESAWEVYATQAKAQAATMEAFHSFAKLRAEQVKAMSAAVKDLYAVLTPEQKNIADAYFGGMHVSQRGFRR